jgi:hypothetical protein
MCVCMCACVHVFMCVRFSKDVFKLILYCLISYPLSIVLSGTVAPAYDRPWFRLDASALFAQQRV